MERYALVLCLECIFFGGGCVGASEYRQDGDYIIGGLFNIHWETHPQQYYTPEVLQCSSETFYNSSYRRFQLMKFSIEEINNSSSLLPGVTLGYNIFDHCSDSQNFPGIFNLLSGKTPFNPWDTTRHNFSEIIALVGASTSPLTRAVAPMFMNNLIPMISFAASSSIFSLKHLYPSFFRTVHTNKNVVEAVVHILQYFKWHWVAFLNIDDEYGNDALAVFLKVIKDTDICLAYTKQLDENTNYTDIFEHIENLNVQVIMVFASAWTVEQLIPSAIKMKFTNKTWIAVDSWALNKNLPKMPGIKSIGTVLGIAEPEITIPGFDDFISSLQIDSQPGEFCNQFCNCSELQPEDILRAETSFNFPVYAAVYAIAHALHNTLQCGDDKCNKSITAYPHMVLSELKRLTFMILNHTIQFDQNGDLRFGHYDVITWNSSGEAEIVGVHTFQSPPCFFIHEFKVDWHTNGQVPSSLCMPECPKGYRRSVEGIHKCCYTCIKCQKDEFINKSVDPYTCVACGETEWSSEASTSCNQRSVEFVPFEDAFAIVILVGNGVLVVVSLLTALLFGLNYNTPVVRSAGGPMCFLILGCLNLCSISVFFCFGKPTTATCIFRYLPFMLWFTVCLACFVVRSFQIVLCFKLAAHYPSLHRMWIRYHGQWLVVLTAFVLQGIFLLVPYTSAPPQPSRDMDWFKDKIILICDNNIKIFIASGSLFLLLCLLCFVFSYMGKELPKNYNEAKAITFCLFLLVLTWTCFATIVILYHGKHIQTIFALAMLSSLYAFVSWYFCPKSYIILFQPEKNTPEYFQGLIKTYNQTN